MYRASTQMPISLRKKVNNFVGAGLSRLDISEMYLLKRGRENPSHMHVGT